MSNFFVTRHLGLLSYQDGLAAQDESHARVLASNIGEVLLLEHKAVITLGQHADHALVLATKGMLDRKGIELAQSDRGGEATCHNPGQLVVYPILPLQRWRLGTKSYVTLLEDVVIDSLAALGLKATTDKDFPGVWVGSKKICALGVRIKQRISLHGLALNIDNDLGIFEHIVPCGIRHRGVTSLVREGFQASVSEFSQVFLESFRMRLTRHLNESGIA